MKDKSLKEIAKKVVDSNYFVLIAVWIIMCIVFTKLQSNFFSYRNMLNILTSGSLVGLLCIGEAYLIIAGMIELSAGAVAGVLRRTGRRFWRGTVCPWGRSCPSPSPEACCLAC